MKTTYLIAGVLIASIGAGAAYAHQGGQGPRGMGQISFETLDANSDGKVTLEELEAHKKARFAKADTNGDGLLSSDEMLARGKAQAGERRAKRMERGIARMIEKRDANGDGMLSIEEIGGDKQGDRFFERLDANGDGEVTTEEFAAHKPGGRRGHGEKPATE